MRKMKVWWCADCKTKMKSGLYINELMCECEDSPKDVLRKVRE